MRKPIGIFDSGIGGLTVVKQLMKLLPDEQLIYFGDTARIPYGTKSKRLIEQYALEDAAFLMQFDIKLVVVACNTASSLAMDVLRRNLDIPVVGVVEPGAVSAAGLTKNNTVGVIGTTATINSGSYASEIAKLDRNIRVLGQPCPLLVPLVEEGWLDDEVTVLTMRKYFKGLMDNHIDTLILGCTHYPLLEETIQRVVGDKVQLIDSGKETAKVVQQLLAEKGLLNISGEKTGEDRFFVSDIPAKFEEIGSRFLGRPLTNVERVDFDQFLVQSGFPANMHKAENNLANMR
ncbi:MAG TPA: glutamate racemase [Caldithrix abyssi]|uniref:Glutamate racemase n=1 Tax=Caldithrix abyssi TaxID=187145 RepID=A0A7V4U0S5_CALAY|nr:glutamate racemase [Caldithrix abyssi]